MQQADPYRQTAPQSENPRPFGRGFLHFRHILRIIFPFASHFLKQKEGMYFTSSASENQIEIDNKTPKQQSVHR